MDVDDYINDAKECIEINFTRPSPGANPDRILDEPVNPEFAHYFFDEGDSIIGYKEPEILLYFRANDLRPSLNVSFKHKVDMSALLTDTQANQVDIETVFHELLPKTAYDPDATSGQQAGPDATSRDWKPPGELLNSFERHGNKYEVWSASLADPAALEIWRNMQILVLFFIDGAVPLDLDEHWQLERWTLHLLYEVTPLEDSTVSPYTLAGFSTSHRYWIFPSLEVLRATKALPSPPASSNGDATSASLPRLELTAESEPGIFKEQIDTLETPCRERISQFLILPQYQRQSLGSRLYETVFGYYVKQRNVYEIPVEDPSEAFDGMRDYCDLAFLRKIPEFRNLSLATSIAPEKLRMDTEVPRDEILGDGVDLTALRHQSKIVPRQFNRMVELHLLSTIPENYRNRARITRKEKSSQENDRKYYFWRLAVKARIYLQNADQLDQLKDDPRDRTEKLENAVDGQEEEYTERLEGIAQHQEENAFGQASNARRRKRGRVVVDEDDEGDGWEDEDDGSVTSKRARR